MADLYGALQTSQQQQQKLNPTGTNLYGNTPAPSQTQPSQQAAPEPQRITATPLQAAPQQPSPQPPAPAPASTSTPSSTAWTR